MSESNQLRIVLSAEASTRLSAMGERTFTVATRQTFPDDPARWVLYLKAVDSDIVEGAVRVMSGELMAVAKPNDSKP